jgi:hypothetical protein
MLVFESHKEAVTAYSRFYLAANKSVYSTELLRVCLWYSFVGRSYSLAPFRCTCSDRKTSDA